MCKKSLWLFTSLLWSSLGSAESIRLTAPHEGTENVPGVSVTDARPEWQKKKEILSLWRTACDFAITRWGDKDSTPSRAQAVAEGLGKFLDESFRDKQVKLTWFTLHTNRQARSSGLDSPNESGIVYGVLHSVECLKGAEMIGGVGADEVSPPAPLIVDIVVEFEGKLFSGRAVKSVAETTVAPVQLVDEALGKLAKSITENAPTPTPCQRLKAAWDTAPKSNFYEKSYRRYCSS